MKSRNKSISTAAVALVIVIIAELFMYVFPSMQLSETLGINMKIGKTDNVTQDYMDKLNSLNSVSNTASSTDVTAPAKDYSAFIGKWKGYFGEEKEPTYMGLFEDLGFEIISCNGSDITYTFWLTGNGISKKLDNTTGKIDENNRLHIEIQGQRAELTFDLVLEDSENVWGVVSNASVLGQTITFPVLFFEKTS